MIPNPGPSLSQNCARYTLGSPHRAFACPHCPRRFQNKGGCTRHVQAMHHADGSELYAPDTDLDARTSGSPVLSRSLPQSPLCGPGSPVPSCLGGHIQAMDHADGSELYAPDMDLDAHMSGSPVLSRSLPQSPLRSPGSPVPSRLGGHSDASAHPSPVPSLPQHDPSPVPSHFHMPSHPPSCDGSNADSNIDLDINIDHVTQVFHPKLNGRSIFLYIYDDGNSILSWISSLPWPGQPE